MQNAVDGGEQIFQNVFTYLLSPIMQALSAVAFLYFFYGVFMFLLNKDNEEKRKDGKRHLLWGMVGLFIIFSINGIIQLLNKMVGGMFGF